MSRWRATTYLAAKDGTSFAECEDAIFANAQQQRFAVADGATEAFASRYWARLLVRAWGWCDPAATTRDAFLELAGHLGDRARKRWEGKQLPWYAEEKARSGSYAAFAGIRINANEWEGVAIGDCCIFQVRNGEIIHAAPLSDPSQFSFRPILLPTARDGQERAERHVIECGMTLAEEDALYVLSDAIACWFLETARCEKQTLQEFDRSLREGSASTLVAAERAAGRMRNDDVAVIRIARS